MRPEKPGKHNEYCENRRGDLFSPLFINSNPLQLHSIYSSEFLPMKQRLEESCLESASFNIARQFEKLSSFFIDYDTVLFDFMF